MWGKRYFARRYFGERYWGTGGDDPSCDYFFTSWDSDSIGSAPSGLTQRGMSSDHTFSVEYSNPPYRQRIAQLDSADNASIAFSVDAIDAFPRRDLIDIAVAIYRDATDEHERVFVHVRGQGTASITDGYQFAVDFTNQRIRIYKIVGGVTTNPFSDLAISHDAGEWRLYRFSATGSSSTSLKARTWLTTDDEPTTWGLSVTDSSSPVTAAGWVGFGGYVPSGSATSRINFFSASAGGCSAVVPVLDVAYIDWLSRPNKRCVIAEFTATGYDSVGALGSPQEPTKTVNVFIANMGYTSRASDTPASQFYPPWIKKIPTFKRESAVELSGKASIGFGSLVVSNPDGARDDWLRMKWKADYIRLYIGDPTWPRVSFRPLLVGRLQQPTAPRTSEIEFPIQDLFAKLMSPIQENRFSDTAPLANQLKPIVAGFVELMEPVPMDVATLDLMIGDGCNITSVFDVYDSGVSLTSSGHSIASVAGNTITANADHGMVAGYRVLFQIGSGPPPPLATNTNYYVAASGLGLDTFQLSATPGGAVITLTGPATGAGQFFAYGWQINHLADGYLTLAANPAGRVVCYQVTEDNDTTHPNYPYNNAIGWIVDRWIFTRYGLSRDFQDQDAFDELLAEVIAIGAGGLAVGQVVYDEQITALDFLDRLCKGAFCWYGFSQEGRLQIGRVSVPSGTAELTLYESDVKENSLALERVFLPMNAATMAVRYNKRWVAQGPLQLPPTADEKLLREYDVHVGTSDGIGVPLDDYPDNAETVDMQPFERLFRVGEFEGDHLKDFYRKKIGRFKFQARIKAITLKIGSVIAIQHSKLGWKTWGPYDASSPDNTGDIDSTLATVIGIDVDLSAQHPYPVTLTVFRHVPGYYPESDLT